MLATAVEPEPRRDLLAPAFEPRAREEPGPLADSPDLPFLGSESGGKEWEEEGLGRREVAIDEEEGAWEKEEYAETGGEVNVMVGGMCVVVSVASVAFTTEDVFFFLSSLAFMSLSLSSASVSFTMELAPASSGDEEREGRWEEGKKGRGRWFWLSSSNRGEFEVVRGVGRGEERRGGG